MTNSHLQADGAVHAGASGEFSTQYDFAKTQLAKVTAINDALYASLQGDARKAFEGAHARWQVAGGNANRLLDDIAQNVGISGVTYTNTDADLGQRFNSTGANIV
ncbi:WXG100 family type VII secretion target [Aldersonia sp. NBC_00410]|uniref:WXG100 family type VII secretion target n=1 Tax=Aldersonia sp. NBC_00410 TaxID=2975954 RepID=UPI00225751BF|nr:WXG100 family type VII secretion target [Aldersonia sp. NBC_00410]MCX5046294.1 WXG100 family type VII secretion target [Aldersonia sp. NBC_00410]